VFLVAPQGSVLVVNSHLIHGGTVNRSTRPRRCVQSSFIPFGNEPFYDWRALPPEIRGGLQPAARERLGLPSED